MSRSALEVARRLATELDWRDEEVVLGGSVFRRLVDQSGAAVDSANEYLGLFKTERTLAEYAECLRAYPGLVPSTIVELGIWNGGSVALWAELFRPQRHIAVDIMTGGDPPHLERFLKAHDLQDRVKTYWGVDQSDAEGMRHILSEELVEVGAIVDLVIDDASHLYGPTRASFECLFPLLRPGGVYFIEDWAWGFWEEYREPTHPWAFEVPMARLVEQIMGAIGVRASPIASMKVTQNVVAVERSEFDAGQLRKVLGG
jgi:hypothetical protein